MRCPPIPIDGREHGGTLGRVSGGTQLIGWGAGSGIASGTTINSGGVQLIGDGGPATAIIPLDRTNFFRFVLPN